MGTIHWGIIVCGNATEVSKEPVFHRSEAEDARWKAEGRGWKPEIRGWKAEGGRQEKRNCRL